MRHKPMRGGVAILGEFPEEKTSSMQERINQFVRDASRISSDLDQVSRRDGREVCALAAETGAQAYAELLQRQDSLQLTRADAAYLEILLDGIRARLKFLS